MSQIKSKNTKPEIRVRQMLHKMGYRFRLHRKDLLGCPDIILPRHKTIIFVHGCYWHRHAGCKYAYEPKTRVEFWNQKFAENVARDRRYQAELSKLGWNVGVIWECETVAKDMLAQRIRDIFGGISGGADSHG